MTAVLLTQKLTVDHILPEDVKRGSGWERDFPDEDQREQWVPRLGNLMLISAKKYAGASEHDFEHKKAYYLTKRKGAQVCTLYTLTCLDVVVNEVDHTLC